MISSKADYVAYRIADGTYRRDLKTWWFDDIKRFLVCLRKYEYYTNCCSGAYGRLFAFYFRLRWRRLGRLLGFSIPINVCGPGLSLPHYGTLVIHPDAMIGRNCRIHICVNIGASGGKSGAPRIGDNVYIAPGAKIYGEIYIADGIAIAANSVVKDSFTDEGITIGGIPAKMISRGGAASAGWNPQRAD